ncbi:MAG: hypothetical protein RLZZ385_2562 [Pseudomonadota bacterium]|jgi:Tfp pilus assembly protein PilN
MKQQVNLYLPEFRIKRDKLTVVVMLQSLGAFMGVLLVLGGWELWTNFALAQEMQDLQGELTVETQRTAEIDQILARRSQDRNLEQQLERAEQNLLASRQMRDVLGETGLGNTDGFSESFKDLSRASLEGLWLTEISLSNGGQAVNLKGFTVDSSLVPMFVARLAEGNSSLTSKQFSVSTVRSSDSVDALYAFELRSTR